MDSSRYWNTIRSLEDWERTRDLWDLARMGLTDYVAGEFQCARGNATRAQHSKLDLFTRELLYLPCQQVLMVFDRVHSKDPSYKKVWLLHGTNEPTVQAADPGRDVGHGETIYMNAQSFTLEDGTGAVTGSHAVAA